jgi:hypothetical protein
MPEAAGLSGAGGSGTVLVWIVEIFDIMLAQQVAKAMGSSLGLDSGKSFSAMVDVSKKGRTLLSGETGGGLLVLKTCMQQGRRALSVSAVKLADVPSEAI